MSDKKTILNTDPINGFNMKELIRIALFDEEYSQTDKDEFIKFYVSYIEKENLLEFEKEIKHYQDKLNQYLLNISNIKNLLLSQEFSDAIKNHKNNIFFDKVSKTES